MKDVIIVSDGVPTLINSLKYVREKGYKDIITVISTKTKESIYEQFNLNNVNFINIISFKYKLNNLIKNKNIIIFSDICSCPSSYFVVKYLLNKDINCKCIFLKFQGLPNKERNAFDYIFYPANLKKKSILVFLKVIVKLFFIYLYRLPINFLSYENCNVTYISPRYKDLINFKSINKRPRYEPFLHINKNKFKRIIFLISPDEINVLGIKGFQKVINIMMYILKLNRKKTLYIKLHPNHDCSCCLNYLIENIDNKYKVVPLENNFNFSKDLLISTISSAIYSYSCLSGINLIEILTFREINEQYNISNLTVYDNSNLEFFKSPKHIYRPKNLTEIKNYFN